MFLINGKHTHQFIFLLEQLIKFRSSLFTTFLSRVLFTSEKNFFFILFPAKAKISSLRQRFFFHLKLKTKQNKSLSCTPFWYFHWLQLPEGWTFWVNHCSGSWFCFISLTSWQVIYVILVTELYTNTYAKEGGPFCIWTSKFTQMVSHYFFTFAFLIIKNI